MPTVNVATDWAVPIVWAQQQIELDFSTWLRWVVWLALVFFGIFPGIVAYMVWAERKVAARFQDRIGPNRVGPLGLLQPIADAIKLLTKENIVPKLADQWVHLLAPVLLLISAFLVMAVVPVGIGSSETEHPAHFTGLVAIDPPSGLLYLIAVSSMGALGIFLAGFYLSKAVKHLFLDKSLVDRVYNYSENPLLFDHSLSLKLSTAFNALGFYFKMLLFPSKMVCYYGYDTIPIHEFASLYAITGMILFTVMVVYFFKLIKTENPIWYAIVFSGISISMYLNIVRPVTGIVAERFLFFASIGFCIFLVHLLFTFLNRKQDSPTLKTTTPAFKGVLILLLLGYSVFTVSRNAEWKNRITLYEHDVKKHPESVPLNLLYSMEILSNMNRPNYFLTEQNKMSYIEKANASLNNVLKIDAKNVTALHNLGFIRQNVYKDYEGAIPYYEKALQSDSAKFESQFNLAYCYYSVGRGEEAEKLVLKIYPTHSDNQSVLDLINYILIENKKSREGILLFDELAKKYPENNSIPIILGNFHLALSDTMNAKKAYSKALEMDPNNDQLFKIVAKLSKQ